MPSSMPHKMVEMAKETGAPFVLDLTRDVVMGHEFCAEVVDYGPNSSGAVRPGDRVVSMPHCSAAGVWKASGTRTKPPVATAS